MIVDNRKKNQLKPGSEVSENLNLKQEGNLKSCKENKIPEALYEKTGKSTDGKLAEYYVQLFFLS